LNLEKIISYTLRIGVILSALLVIIGLAIYFVEGDRNLSVSSSFDFFQVFVGLARGDPLAIMLLGVIVLVLTPLLRVFELVLSYAWERDRLYITLSSVVLLFMVAGIILLPIITRT
jgi:uncharacterized membrane protein